MADVENFMGVGASDIEKIMGVAAADVEKVMGLGLVTSPSWVGTRAVIFGGELSGVSGTDVIEYKAFGSGDMSDFGDLSGGYRYVTAFSNGSRGVANLSLDSNILEYVTIGSTGDSTDFGDVTVQRAYTGSASSGATGFIFGGYASGDRQNIIDYVTIASTGNATDWGDLTAEMMLGEGISGSARIVCNLGYNNSTGSFVYGNEIDYFATASTGDASDFGDLDQALGRNSTAENSTRGIFLGGYLTSRLDNIQYVTVASTGNATDFGNLIEGVSDTGGASDGTRAEAYGGLGASQRYLDNIQYITIASTGNATDDGDLTTGTEQTGACSGT